jgi:meiotically up-regulated gene 157 (Mug157) protein
MPYVTYDNALIWKALTFLSELGAGQGHTLSSAALAVLAGDVREAIMEHCVVDGPMGRQFAGAVDLNGHHVLLDEPPGSLALLPHYGFCPLDDAIYRTTLRWIGSTENPHLGPAGRFQTASCVHAPHSWTLSLANMLLSGQGEQAAEILRAAPLDGGLACESFDAATGLPKTGRHFAACAGFLGYALHSWLKSQ